MTGFSGMKTPRMLVEEATPCHFARRGMVQSEFPRRVHRRQSGFEHRPPTRYVLGKRKTEVARVQGTDLASNFGGKLVPIHVAAEIAIRIVPPLPQHARLRAEKSKPLQQIDHLRHRLIGLREMGLETRE